MLQIKGKSCRHVRVCARNANAPSFFDFSHLLIVPYDFIIRLLRERSKMQMLQQKYGAGCNADLRNNMLLQTRLS